MTPSPPTGYLDTASGIQRGSEDSRSSMRIDAQETTRRITIHQIQSQSHVLIHDDPSVCSILGVCPYACVRAGVSGRGHTRCKRCSWLRSSEHEDASPRSSGCSSSERSPQYARAAARLDMHAEPSLRGSGKFRPNRHTQRAGSDEHEHLSALSGAFPRLIRPLGSLGRVVLVETARSPSA